MGYGDVEALEIIRETSNEQMFDLREQPGVRIGVVVSDNRTMVYAPVSRNVEAGSTTEEKPNAIMLHADATEKLAEATGAAEGEMEVGVTGMEPDRVVEMVADLKTNPPHPFDLTRKMRVFVTEVLIHRTPCSECDLRFPQDQATSAFPKVRGRGTTTQHRFQSQNPHRLGHGTRYLDQVLSR